VLPRRGVLARIFRFLRVADHWHPDYETRFGATADDRRLTPLARGLVAVPKPRAYRRLPAGTRARIRRAVTRPLSRPYPGVVLSPPIRARLEEVLAPDTARLRHLTGEPFASWTV
jgi:hypothetical protein